MPAADLERVKTQLVAEAIYAQDNQATLARWYGAALTTGLSVDDIRSWPDRVRAVGDLWADMPKRRRSLKKALTRVKSEV